MNEWQSNMVFLYTHYALIYFNVFLNKVETIKISSNQVSIKNINYIFDENN